MRRQRLFTLWLISDIVLLLGFSTLSAQRTISPGVLAQAPRPTLTPRPRPTLTPRPSGEEPSSPEPSSPEPSSSGGSADIRWLQTISSTSGVSDQAMLPITVRGVNIGNGSGRSDAILSYDPAALRLLDAVPLRSSDWVRTRDDAAGTLTLAVGTLAPDEQAMIQVRFLIQQNNSTTIRLVRDDARDRANPLFLDLAHVTEDPIPLTVQQIGSTITITGRGYKPGETLVLWANTRQGSVIAIDETFTAMNDEDGSIDLLLPVPEPDVASIVVRGDMSDVLGVAEVGSETGE